MKTENKKKCACCGSTIKKQDIKNTLNNWGVCYGCEKELKKL